MELSMGRCRLVGFFSLVRVSRWRRVSSCGLRCEHVAPSRSVRWARFHTNITCASALTLFVELPLMMALLRLKHEKEKGNLHRPPPEVSDKCTALPTFQLITPASLNERESTPLVFRYICENFELLTFRE